MVITIMRPVGVGADTCHRFVDALQQDRIWARVLRVEDGEVRRTRYIGTAWTDSINLPWGLSTPVATYNNGTAVHNAGNKTYSRRVMRQNDIPVPTPWYGDTIPVYPMIARPTRHARGQHFYVIRNDADLRRCPINNTNGYFSAVFPKTHEYRVHCAHGKILFIQNKGFQPDPNGDIRANQFITETEWITVPWSQTKNRLMKQVMRAALSAVDILGLDYGAVDVMVNTTNNSVAVCEVNTAPSIDGPYWISRYTRYFKWLMNEKHREHWPWKTYEQAVSFFWKDGNYNGGGTE